MNYQEFSLEDNEELFLEEKEASIEQTNRKLWQYKATVPGLLAPSEAVGVLSSRTNNGDDSD